MLECSVRSMTRLRAVPLAATCPPVLSPRSSPAWSAAAAGLTERARERRRRATGGVHAWPLPRGFVRWRAACALARGGRPAVAARRRRGARTLWPARPGRGVRTSWRRDRDAAFAPPGGARGTWPARGTRPRTPTGTRPRGTPTGTGLSRHRDGDAASRQAAQAGLLGAGLDGGGAAAAARGGALRPDLDLGAAAAGEVAVVEGDAADGALVAG